MKLAIIAAAMLVGAAPLAAQTGTHQATPPGDELTAQGTNPEGTPCTPIGQDLIGLAVRQAIDWPSPNGRTRTLRILAVRPPPA